MVEQGLPILTKISYIPFSKNKINPGYDQRNILLYSYFTKIKINEFSNNIDNSDIIILPPSYDPTNLSIFQYENTKVIYQLVDDYLSVSTFSFKNIFRGVVNFFLGKGKKLTINYKKNQEQLCKLSDAVICSSEEQQKKILKFNNNCHIFFEGNFHISNATKKYSNNSDLIKLVWEGRAENLNNLSIISEAFKKLTNKYKIELHIISDLNYPQFLFFRVSSITLLKKIFGELFQLNTTIKKSYIFFHQWNKNFVSSVIKNCDYAIIPLNLNDKFLFGKSMNKLILMWRNDIISICSSTTSYKNLSNDINIDFCCKNSDEWYSKIESLIINKNNNELHLKKIKEIIESKYSKKNFIEQWDNIIKSVK